MKLNPEFNGVRERSFSHTAPILFVMGRIKLRYYNRCFRRIYLNWSDGGGGWYTVPWKEPYNIINLEPQHLWEGRSKLEIK